MARQEQSGRNVLEGVPRVGFYPDVHCLDPTRGPEDIIFPSCMRAVMEYLGHPEYDYIHFVGVTGAATVRPYDAHDDAVGTVAEGRYYASEYLIRVAQAELEMRAPLLKAAGCYAQEHDLMWQVWGCVGGNGRSPENVERFADRGTRRRIVELIREAKRQDEQAIMHIEEALVSAG